MPAITRLSLTGVILYSVLALGCSNDKAGGRGGGDGDGDGNGSGNGGRGSNGSGGKSGGGITINPDVLAASCSNGKIDAASGEVCDDGNKTNLDGCNELCQLEADYECPTPGAACIFSAACGDGKLATREACDDGNTMPGDGCSADCTSVEDGFQCRVPGKHCVPLCGDGKLTGSENCDDLNTMSGDGCSATCLEEPGWSCEGAGATCKQSVCGNSMVEAGETCDAGPQNGLFFGDGTGCSKTCTKEPSCRNAAGATTACATPCGDGNIDPSEMCDDGNQVDGDGCSKTCTPEAGFTCMAAERPDTTACASGQCLVLPITYRDFDGQHVPTTGHPDFFYYGATVGATKTTCVPNASGANLLPQPMNGTCPPTDATDPCTKLVNDALGPDGKPVYNPMGGNGTGGSTCKCTFTDWDTTGVITGGTQCASGAAAPFYVRDVAVKVIQSADSFKQWYNDSALSTKVVDKLELAQLPGGNQFQFSSSNGRTVYEDIHDIWLATKMLPVPAGGATSLSSGFFPLEATMRPKLCNLWSYWRAPAACVANDNLSVWQQWDPRAWNSGGAAPQPMEVLGAPVKPVTGMNRNFYFTSEVRYLFRFAGGETLGFFGDDDVWVFINGKLVLDLGAPHERMKGQVTLDMTGASAAWTKSVQNLQTGMDIALPATHGSGTVTGLGLEVGKTYEIAIFHADRHPRESNYQLTLSGYSTKRSQCQPTCGDGVATAAEECDEGTANMNGVYGGCTTQCKFGPFCGDGTVDMADGEQCDAGRMNGVNAGYNSDGCTASCKKPPRCGDGVTDTGNGEQCDAGDQNGAMGVCTDKCTFVPR